jgi:hypothetical protein
MKLVRYVQTASVAAAMTMAMAGTALADDVSLDSTGPDSNQTVSVSNTNTVDTTTTNTVSVVNNQVQQAVSGNVSADRNTSVGGLGSGNAANKATTETSVTIGNESSVTPGAGESVPGSGGPVSGGSSVPVTENPGSGGAVLGAQSEPVGFGAGEEMLPEVGASVPVDVSALRAAWRPATDTTAAHKFADRANAISAAMFATAAMLSLIGAFASAIAARRKQRRA